MALSSHPAGVRYVKLRALSSQGGSSFMDVAEIQVFATAADAPAAASAPAARSARRAKLKFLTKRAKLSKRRAFVVEARRARRARGRTRCSP